jgi:GxxExxY protein
MLFLFAVETPANKNILSIIQFIIMDINQLSSKIIGAAIEVHRILGPGLLESAYEECICYELELRRIKFERQKALPVIYKGKRLDCGYRLDIVIENRIITELKSIEKIEPIHKAQLLSYLKLSGQKLGLLLNFNVSVMKDGIVRLVNHLEE